ncbi:TIGR04255 family protein [Rhodopila sp.]|uniref:TIGR04255 family protein n=1 Tax=Rhodopila sp. TaxID=2480087 RepID=UPI003D0ED684
MSGTLEDLFPASPRVFYRKAPLLQVVCQVRFPPLLRVESELPAAFQEKIRSVFPLFERLSTPVLPFGVPPELLQSLAVPGITSRYVFLTEDRCSTVGLASDSLTIDTKTYRTWEEFQTHVRLAYEALTSIYQPNFLSRVGLRYQDFLDREKIGIPNKAWSSLLRTEILGELANESIERHVQGVSRTVRVVMPRACYGPAAE